MIRRFERHAERGLVRVGGKFMKAISCPKCGSSRLRHFTDAYVIRTPVINDEGEIELLDDDTNEYDDSFFECDDCGHRPEEDELLPLE